MIKASSAKILGEDVLEALNDLGDEPKDPKKDAAEDAKEGDGMKCGGMVRKMAAGGMVDDELNRRIAQIPAGGTAPAPDGSNTGSDFTRNATNTAMALPGVGGALAGLAGAFTVLVQFKAWQENITGGVGWIAVALVVFATWRPSRLFAGALLFGLMRSLGFATQAASQQIQDWLVTQSDWVQKLVSFLTNAQLLNALPYIATIVVLCWISRDWRKIKLNAPASLSQPFLP